MRYPLRIFFALLINLSLLLPCVYAKSTIPGDSVYVSEDERGKLIEIIQTNSDFKDFLKQQGLTLETDSLTPVYTIDLDDYGLTETLFIKPFQINPISTSELETGNVYIVKTITESNTFGGNLQFYVENGAAFLLNFTPSEITYKKEIPDAFTMASCYYEDHAERIKGLLEFEDTVPPSCVRYVIISSLGPAFFVQYNEKEVVILVGYEQFFSDTIMNVNSDLLTAARDYHLQQEEQRRQIEEWQKEHPNESLGGGEASISSTTVNNATKKNSIIFVCVTTVLVAVFVLAFVMGHKKGKRSKDGKSE